MLKYRWSKRKRETKNERGQTITVFKEQKTLTKKGEGGEWIWSVFNVRSEVENQVNLYLMLVDDVIMLYVYLLCCIKQVCDIIDERQGNQLEVQSICV